MRTRLDLRGTGPDALARLPRPGMADAPPVAAVAAIVADVRARGDEAVLEITERIDGVRPSALRVPHDELTAALAALDPDLRAALEVAKERIGSYHRSQLHDLATYDDAGISVRELRRPVDRAACYVPGGTAPLISTVLMTVVPARVAAVPEVVLLTPPGPDGRPHPSILAAAALADVDLVLTANGPAGIAALATGTDAFPKVDVIVGPGNAYVAQAKREVAAAGLVGVPSAFAGPSEVVVVADETTPPEYAAVDLLVQIEHGPDGLAWLITWSEDVADRIAEVAEKLAASAERREIIAGNLESNAYVAIVDGPEHAIELANAIAPEHLQLMCADPESLLPLVRHAGAVFCGPYSPASLGDYLAGPNHVLPTYGSARFSGALRVDDFCKVIHVVTADEAALAALTPHLEVIARAEGLGVHAESVRMRGPR